MAFGGPVGQGKVSKRMTFEKRYRVWEWGIWWKSIQPEGAKSVKNSKVELAG